MQNIEEGKKIRMKIVFCGHDILPVGFTNFPNLLNLVSLGQGLIINAAEKTENIVKWRKGGVSMQEAESLGLNEARKIVDAIIEASAKGEGRPMAAAVVDRHGDLVYFARMDGASPLTARMSINKASTAIDAKRDTIESRKLLKELDLEFYEFCSPTYTTIPGGVLIKTEDGNIVGAVGTSGRAPLAPMVDEELARIGAKAFKD